MNGIGCYDECRISEIFGFIRQSFHEESPDPFVVKIFNEEMPVMVFPADCKKCQPFSKTKLPAVCNDVRYAEILFPGQFTFDD